MDAPLLVNEQRTSRQTPFILSLHRLIEENIRCLADEPGGTAGELAATAIDSCPSPSASVAGGHQPVSTFALWSVRQRRSLTTAGHPRHHQFMDLIGQIVSKVLRSSSPPPPAESCVSCQATLGRRENATTATTASEPAPVSRRLGRDDWSLLAQTNVSEATFHKIIEFEFNQEPELRRVFQASRTESQLNRLEWARIEQYERMLLPLRYSLSAHSRKQARMKDSINRYFLNEDAEGTVSFEQQQRAMVQTAQAGLDLLVSLTKQIDSFSALLAQDQINLLKDNVMQIMTLRSMLLANRPPFPAGCKRPLAFDSDSDTDDTADDQLDQPHKRPKAPAEAAEPEPQPEATAGHSHRMALEYGQRFRYHYHRMAQAIDKRWQDDSYIFYLVLAILLFQSRQPDRISNIGQVRQEYFTNIYLLKRYLEHKFESVCLARTHFIRLFNMIEEIHLMDQHVIQKLLDYNLTYAQNLLERLCF